MPRLLNAAQGNRIWPGSECACQRPVLPSCHAESACFHDLSELIMRSAAKPHAGMINGWRVLRLDFFAPSIVLTVKCVMLYNLVY